MNYTELKKQLLSDPKVKAEYDALEPEYQVNLDMFQEQMSGEGEKAGLFSEEDVANWITQSRREENAE